MSQRITAILSLMLAISVHCLCFDSALPHQSVKRACYLKQPRGLAQAPDDGTPQGRLLCEKHAHEGPQSFNSALHAHSRAKENANHAPTVID